MKSAFVNVTCVCRPQDTIASNLLQLVTKACCQQHHLWAPTDSGLESSESCTVCRHTKLGC